MKCVTKHPAPEYRAIGTLVLPTGSKFVGAGYDNGKVVLYTEGEPWASNCVYWEVQCFKVGESYANGMEVLASIEAPDAPVGYDADRLFYVGRING